MSHFGIGLIRQPTRTFISGSTGTAIGNATSSGGLAAAFDGVTNQTQAASAAVLPTSNSGYNNTVGKDWGVGKTKRITQVSFWSPNNSGIINTADTTVKFQGSTDNSTWVDLYTSPTLTGSGSSNYTTTLNTSLTTFDASTAYRYHRLNFNGNNTNQMALAEVWFYEDI